MTEELVLESFDTSHIEGAVLLSRQAGWPHRREDWGLILAVSEGVVALVDGRVVATIFMTPYGSNAATINMVIVDETIRGQGLGRKIMNAALEKAGDRTCLLVATQAGLPLYEKLGFVVNGEVRQHQGNVTEIAKPAGVEWAGTDDHAAISAIDRSASGLQRDRLMAELARCARFAVIRRNGSCVAAAGIRAFGRGSVIGPVLSENLEQAKALIDFILSHHEGEFLRLDTRSDTGLGPWLATRGLADISGGITMQRGDLDAEASPSHHVYALVNQALG